MSMQSEPNHRTSTIPAPSSTIEHVAAQAEPRESMRVLPIFLQPALTWLTGKPLVGERSWNLGPLHHLLASVLPLAGGALLGFGAVLAGGWWLLFLPLSWLFTAHGARKLRTMILHQCSHINFSRRPAIDEALGRLIALALVSQEFKEYKHEHVSDHHSSSHMTLEDPTVQFLILSMRARAGMTRQQLWRRLGWTLVSPSFHLKATYARLASHFRDTTPAYRSVLCGLLAAQVITVALTGTWLAFLLAWVFPLTVLFNAAATLRLSCRHIFPAPGPRVKGRASMAGFTHGIFLGERCPSADLPLPQRFVAWGWWWARMLCIHLPARLFVLVGDGPCHDYHHRFARAKDWPNYIFARHCDLVAGHPGWPAYTEVWGLVAAIDAVFVSLSQADPSAYDPAHLIASAPAELLAAFEE